MSDNDGVKNRIKQYIEYLNIPISAFEKNCGLSNGYVSSIRKGIGHKALEQISEKYSEINKSWLLTGEGEMLKNVQFKDTEAKKVFMNIIQIPVVSQYAYAGYLGGFDDPGYMESLPTHPIPMDRELKGKYLFFEIKGDSMEDGSMESYREGDLALAREVYQEYWKYKLHIKRWDFVIVHKTEGIIIKRIINHDIENGTITVHSLNSFYEDRILKLSDVAQLFNVVQIVRKF
ncbi:peptidase S24 [Apibacter muscae]|uniref:S24 family peptidase n=1 Tax=Apibacter muscae TaxID=2509004 RepID=UPI0011ADA8F9|nr:S24 family peptidase [Apibacter muscae]TWP23100.1 peptidase S24 [Apibacter muscae]